MVCKAMTCWLQSTGETLEPWTRKKSQRACKHARNLTLNGRRRPQRLRQKIRNLPPTTRRAQQKLKIMRAWQKLRMELQLERAKNDGNVERKAVPGAAVAGVISTVVVVAAVTSHQEVTLRHQRQARLQRKARLQVGLLHHLGLCRVRHQDRQWAGLARHRLELRRRRRLHRNIL